MTLVKSPETIEGLRVVQDADSMIAALMNKETIFHWEFGHSMSPMFPNKGYCKIYPLADGELENIQAGDAVFCIVNGYPMVHMVWQVSHMDDNRLWFHIGSTSGALYGWTDTIFGIAKATDYVEDIEDPEPEEKEGE